MRKGCWVWSVVMVLVLESTMWSVDVAGLLERNDDDVRSTHGIPRRANCESCTAAQRAAAEAAQRVKKSKSMGLDEDVSGPRISVHVPELVDYYSTQSSNHVQNLNRDNAAKESAERNLILELPFRCRMGRYFPHVRDFVDTHGETLYAGVDPRILVLDGNYVKRVHRVQAHASVSDIAEAVQAAKDEYIKNDDSDEL